MSSVKTILVGFCLLVFLAAKAQTSRDVGAPKPPKPVYQAQKIEKKQFFLKRMIQKKQLTEVEQFRANVKRVHKEKAKQQKKMDKPQYKDPTYFGHKRPPKKRPPGKMKFCKECKLVH
jgi:hypothetical protein